MKSPAVIFDRDGTLASCPNRPADKSNDAWAEFNACLPFDPVVPVVAALLGAIRPGVTRIMTSGRAAGDFKGDQRRRFAMRDWLDKHNLPIDLLFMRQGGDNRRDSVVKAEIYEQHIRPHFDVAFAIDDRPQVIEVWESFGIPVLTVTDPDLPFNIGNTTELHPTSKGA